MKIGLVVEGTHDYPILSTAITKFAQECGYSDVEFVKLQPQPDATTKSTEGGFGRVIGWCKANSGEALRSILETPLFAGEEVCDLLVVHLDGDAVRDCAPHASLLIPDGDLSPEDRVKYLREMIEEWLEAEAPHRDKVVTAIPVMQTEAWILASTSPNNHPWETVDSKATLYSEMNFSGKKKKPQFYSRMAAAMLNNIDLAIKRCTSLTTFKATIVQAMNKSTP